MDKLLAHAERMVGAVPELLKQYTDSELRTLRKGTGFTPELVDKMGTTILWFAATAFRDFNCQNLPTPGELLDTLVFRVAICFHVWHLQWIEGAPMTNAARIRNDMVDVNFAAYATLFDGFLSADKRAKTIYAEALNVLRLLCDAP
jgi:hypothetical protein